MHCSSLYEHDKVSFQCFKPSTEEDPCSPAVCTGNITDVVQSNDYKHNEDGKGEIEIWLKLSIDLGTTNHGSIWELSFSSANVSNKLEGNKFSKIAACIYFEYF